jgi:hypothetical protein
MLENLSSQLAQEPRPVVKWKFQENLIDTFAPGIPNGSKAISSNCPRYSTRGVGYDEPESTAADPTDKRPEVPRCPSTISITRHPFFAQHLFEYRAKLLGRSLLAVSGAEPE